MVRVARDIRPLLERRFGEMPIVTLTGPRQSGKTTLARAAFARLPYASLEDPEAREAAHHDPRTFLAQFRDGAVIDEIQRVPELPSYLQGIVDRERRNGLFVLTGSQNFGLHAAISQSLAGRTAILELLPLTHREVRRFERPPVGLAATLLAGGYPRVHEQRLRPHEFFADYVATYVERDVRQILAVGDLATFQTFVRLCAGRSGQSLNMASLAADAGVSPATVRTWLSVLETSYLLMLLRPWHTNTNKRLAKRPKLYFLDTGLLCYLLGIRAAEHFAPHPLRGAIFETWVVSEIVKARLNRGEREPLHYYAESGRNEVDLVVELPDRCLAVEIKSGQRVPRSAYRAFEPFESVYRGHALARPTIERIVVHGGDESTALHGARQLAWSDVADASWS